MKGKPIEAGCLAMIVNHRVIENNGIVVTVVRKMEPDYVTPVMTSLGVEPYESDGSEWVVKTEGKNRMVCTVDLILYDTMVVGKQSFTCDERAFREKYMRRLDDDSLEDETLNEEAPHETHS